MRLISEHDLPGDRPRLVYAEARWYWVGQSVIWPAVGLCFFYGLFSKMMSSRRLDYPVLVISLLILFALGYASIFAVRRAFAAFGPDNWVVLVTRQGLIIRIRHFMRADLPEDGPSIAVIDFNEIAALGEYVEHWTSPIGRRTPSDIAIPGERFIDITLTHDQTEKLRVYLAREQLSAGSALSVLVPIPGVIRLRFRGGQRCIVPGPELIVRMLGERLRVEPLVKKRWRSPQLLRGRELLDYVDARCDRGDYRSARIALGRGSKCSWLEAGQIIKERRRILAGFCGTCGYDMCSTPDRCPECGAPQVR